MTVNHSNKGGHRSGWDGEKSKEMFRAWLVKLEGAERRRPLREEGVRVTLLQDRAVAFTAFFLHQRTCAHSTNGRRVITRRTVNAQLKAIKVHVPGAENSLVLSKNARPRPLTLVEDFFLIGEKPPG